MPRSAPRLKADFNGVFRSADGLFLCLSHRETCQDENDNDVVMTEGIVVTAFDLDDDEQGRPDNILATGTVDRAPDWLAHTGSRWLVRVDGRGMHHESDDV